ncbi:MAG: hypothetical protein HUU50_22950 [Candidatus Brocadiae bacterium]|nr:hypothetical protein [Candidatus Brocadiia bacterium]
MYRLCKEFGWTPDTIKKQDATDIECLILVLQEIEQVGKILSKTSENETVILLED